MRHVARARDAIILIACRKQLSGRIVNHTLVEGLTDPLRHAAMDLPLNKHRVDRDTDVIDRRITHHAGHSGLGIDFHLTDVRAVRPCRPVDIPLTVNGETRILFVLCQVEQADAAVGTHHRQHTIAIFDIAD